MYKYFNGLLVRILKSEKGVTAIYFGLAMPVFLGFAGLAFDASMWYMERRILQSTIDSATLSAAYSDRNGGTADNMLTAAKSSAEINNYSVGGSKTLVVNSPPTSGRFSGQSGYIQGELTAPARGFFSAAFGVSSPTISTRATATVLTNGTACMVALNQTADKAIELSGSANIDMNCGVASNSDSSQAAYLNGNVTISAEPAISADGDVYEGGSSSVADDTEIIPNNGDVKDPYDNIEVPIDVGCDITFGNGPSGTLSGNVSSPFITEITDPGGTVVGYELEPGRYCGDFPIDGETVELQPGQYVLENADFDVNSSGTSLTGDAVSIVLTGDSPADIGQIDIQGGNINIQAISPTDRSTGTVTGVSPAYDGVVFYVDKNAPFAATGNDTHLINGNSNIIIDGSIYIPSQLIDYLGSTGNSATCQQVIASMIKVSGNTNTTITNSTAACEALGAKSALIQLVLLVE